VRARGLQTSEPRDMAVCRPADPSGRADRHGPRWPNPDPKPLNPASKLATNLRPKTARHACKNETCQLPVLFRFPVRDGSSDQTALAADIQRCVRSPGIFLEAAGSSRRLGKSRHCCGFDRLDPANDSLQENTFAVGFFRGVPAPRRSSRNRVNCSVNSWTRQAEVTRPSRSISASVSPHTALAATTRRCKR